MSDLGAYALLLSLVVSLYSAVAAFHGARTGAREYVESAYRGVWAVFGLLTLASVALIYLLAARDMNVEYVARYTSSMLPMAYAIPAFWAGNGGSLLLWAWLLSCFTAIVVWRRQGATSALIPHAVGILMLVAVFFLGLVLFLFDVDAELGSSPQTVTDPFYSAYQSVLIGLTWMLGGASSWMGEAHRALSTGAIHPTTNPFWRLAFTPQEGLGLNPQLQNPGMLVHPPTLYLGYVGMAIPFAFALASLMARRVDNAWVRLTRRWNLAAWLFLSVGNVLGAWWAYVTLGWGGYWGWDPVENAAFIPWLLSTAFLHSVMIQEKRGRLRTWNTVLIVATFVSTIFGTYLTRSGVISSVHAFAQNQAFNVLFLLFMAATVAGAAYLIITRLDLLAADTQLDSVFSREAAVVFSNVVFVGAAVVVLFGTVLPLTSEAVTGVQQVAGPAWFNSILWPLWLGLLLLTAVGPLIAWRQAGRANVRGSFTYPVAAALASMVVMLAFGYRDGLAVAFVALSVLIAAAVVQEFVRGARARVQVADETPAQAVLGLFTKQNRRFGGYVAHLGVAVMVLGITASSVYKAEYDFSLAPGETKAVGEFTVEHRGFRSYFETNRTVHAVSVDVTRGGRPMGVMEIVQEDYQAERMRWTKPTIVSSVLGDTYLTLASFQNENSPVTVNLKHNPLVGWIWAGGVISVLGGLLALWRGKRESSAGSRGAAMDESEGAPEPAASEVAHV